MPGLGQEAGRTVSKWASAGGKNARLLDSCRVRYRDAGHHVNACAIYNSYRV
jgi:hypothetical protein